MIESRIKSSHTYDEATADEIDDLLLPYLFDISILNQISNLALKEHIGRVGREFYCRK